MLRLVFAAIITLLLEVPLLQVAGGLLLGITAAGIFELVAWFWARRSSPTEAG